MAPDVVLLTTSELADLFRVDERTIRRWADEGQLQPVPMPGRLKRFRRSDVEAILRGEAPAASRGAA